MLSVDSHLVWVAFLTRFTTLFFTECEICNSAEAIPALVYAAVLLLAVCGDWMFWLGHENYIWKQDETPHTYSIGVCSCTPGHIYVTYGTGNSSL